MFTLNDVYCIIVLKAFYVMSTDDKFLDPIIPIFYLQRYLLFRHE